MVFSIDLINLKFRIACSNDVHTSQFSGGYICKGSELKVEVAEFLWRGVQVSV